MATYSKLTGSIKSNVTNNVTSEVKDSVKKAVEESLIPTNVVEQTPETETPPPLEEEVSYTPEEMDIKKNEIKLGIDDTKARLTAENQTLEGALQNIDLTTPQGIVNYSYISDRVSSNNIKISDLDTLKSDIDKEIYQRDDEGNYIKDDDGNFLKEEKWSLDDTTKVLKILGSTALLTGSVMALIEDNEQEKVDVQQTLRENADAITDPVLNEKILDASYRDLPATSDLTQLSSYNNQFGSLSGDYFGGDYGPELEAKFAEWAVDNPDGTRDQFLMEWARANPTNALAQDIRYRTSRLGQLERTSDFISDLDRQQAIDNVVAGGNFYKRKELGGMGYKTSDFRTPEQQQIVQKAMGLLNDPAVQQVKDSIGRRINTQGRLTTEEVRDITDRSLTSVDPSLSGQAYLRQGGLGRAVLNNASAQRQRLREDEASMLGLINSERQYAPVATNVYQNNTLDPLKALGVSSGTGTANQIYSSDPNTGQNYDPTSGYFSSLTGLNANIDQANMLNPSVYDRIADTAEAGTDFIDSLQS